MTPSAVGRGTHGDCCCAAFEDFGHLPGDGRGIAFEQRQRGEDRSIGLALRDRQHRSTMSLSASSIWIVEPPPRGHVSQLTHRWREKDSNPRSPEQKLHRLFF
jgi:hypothetical protein